MAGRPASTSTRRFSRTLAPAQTAILAAAGDGDISAGFLNLLDLYQRAHCLGYSVDSLIILLNSLHEDNGAQV